MIVSVNADVYGIVIRLRERKDVHLLLDISFDCSLILKDVSINQPVNKGQGPCERP